MGLFIVSPLSKESTIGTMEALVFREIRDLIPFHVLLILFQFVSKYLSQEGYLLFHTFYYFKGPFYLLVIYLQAIISTKSDYCFTLIYYLTKDLRIYLQICIIYYFENLNKNRHAQTLIDDCSSSHQKRSAIMIFSFDLFFI